MTTSKLLYLLAVFVPGGLAIAALILAGQSIRRHIEQRPHPTARARLPFAGS